MPGPPWRTFGDHGYHRAMSPSRRPRPSRQACADTDPSTAPQAAGGPPRQARRAAARRRGARRRGDRRGDGGDDLRAALRPLGAASREDRAEHVRLRRGRVPPRRDPRRAEPPGRPSRADVALAAARDGGDRRSPLLLAWRDRRRGDRPRALARPERRPRRRGRLDDHAAARPHPLHLERAHRRAEGHRGVPGREARPQVVEGANPRHVPQLRLLRQPRIRRRGGGTHVLLPLGEPSHALPGGACSRG